MVDYISDPSYVNNLLNRIMMRVHDHLGYDDIWHYQHPIEDHGKATLHLEVTMTSCVAYITRIVQGVSSVSQWHTSTQGTGYRILEDLPLTPTHINAQCLNRHDITTPHQAWVAGFHSHEGLKGHDQCPYTTYPSTVGRALWLQGHTVAEQDPAAYPDYFFITL